VTLPPEQLNIPPALAVPETVGGPIVDGGAVSGATEPTGGTELARTGTQPGSPYAVAGTNTAVLGWLPGNVILRTVKWPPLTS
jgi:hypothetical protein